MTSSRRSLRAVWMAAFVALGGVASAAHATLPAWLQHVVSASRLESALYRSMQLQTLQALYPRPPKEAQAELSRLIASAPDQAELYLVRARTDEQALDETAASSDWMLYATRAKDPVAGKLALADFYQRRLLIPQAIAVLREVAEAPAAGPETYLEPTRQRSWQAFDRILALCVDQALPPEQTRATFNAFLTRYPAEPAVYARALQWLLEQKDWNGADELIARYQRALPQDRAFPVRAHAAVAAASGNGMAALAIYDRAFEPLWPQSLTQAYFSLLEQTHQQRAFVAAARAQLAAHPDGPEALNAVARIFQSEEQAGRSQAAQRTLDAFRVEREARKAAWSPNDLATLAALTLATHSYAESARYQYALASLPGTLPSGEPAAQAGLSGLIQIMLEASASPSGAAPLALGAQNLSLYRDIATLDQGPGYWNGILSLWLNGTSPGSEYDAESSKAQSYFHRSKAAELLRELDHRFPNAPQRAALHAELIQAIARYGEPGLVVAAAREFLNSFRTAPERQGVVEALADAYAQQNDTASEFALYETQLSELSAATNGQPLTAAAPAGRPEQAFSGDVTLENFSRPYADSLVREASPLAGTPERGSLPQAAAYARILDRYLGRLTATNQLPRALTVLRTQIDRNPDDPLLYERLAAFLQQNNLSAEQERLFEQAIAHFQQPGYYDKLARLYLREKKREAYASLTRKVTDIFSGMDLDAYFASVNDGSTIGPQLALALNLYAAKRFPHDLVFTRNLLAAYQAKATRDPVAYDSLLRHVWFESDSLQTEFLTYLARTGKLESERAALEAAVRPDQDIRENPASVREESALLTFTSNFEQAAPLLRTLAGLYPADPEVVEPAVSLFRSLAYHDPTRSSTARAVALETGLLQAEPDSPDRLATLGDLYAEATAEGGEDLASAAAYWRLIPTLHPGSAQGFLASATLFWDYFQFQDSRDQINQARTRFRAPALFAYEAGALAESRHDLPEAVAEYTEAVIHPLDRPKQTDSVNSVVDTFFKPPSDVADSNLWSVGQSLAGSPEANARLLVLATRSASAGLVDATTARAVSDHPIDPTALSLRASVLVAQKHESALAELFAQALSHASTADEAASVGGLAQSRNLTPVYEEALARQASLTPDPVQRIELQYTLARSLEARKDVASATRIMDGIYRANPRILGVVRATTDFYGRTEQPVQAIDTLLEAARSATPELARNFTLEAADRANDANDTTQARALATVLLAGSPYDARVLSILATSYARAHDDAGLKSFYLTELDQAAHTANLAPEARRRDIALLRRGLIPALTRLNDFEGATDQYIALLSAYPDDTSTGQEAALYALQHARQAQLLDFLRTAVRQSPRDSRFSILLAQTEVTFEDLPAAEAAYDAAITLRKDRADLYTARLNLELRLNQFDAAAADLERLYLLSYHDPGWMVRLAELRARQQRPAEAVTALETAYITGHTAGAEDAFRVADQLAQWGLLTEARTYAERGVALAGADLLIARPANTDPQLPSGAAIYATVLTRLGHADTALATLTAASRQAELSASSPAVLEAELARENLAQDEAADFRKNFAARHRQAAEAELQTATRAIGAAVQTYATPEQKLAYAQTLDTLHATDPKLALNAASSAGLTDREATWRRQILLSGPPAEAASSLQPYTTLEQHRLAFADLAQTLEGYAGRLKPEQRPSILRQAAAAWRDAGNVAGELRVERSANLADDPALQSRFFDLLLDHDPQALAVFAASPNTTLADAAVNYSVAHASQAQALAAVAARGRTLPAVWRPASASLVETYFSTPGAQTNLADFMQSLRFEPKIAERIGRPVDPTTELAGDLFFSYASRLGIVLLTAAPNPKLTLDPPAAEDFLPAELERSPNTAGPYLRLARTYAEVNDVPAAVVEYRHALELNPADAAIQDELATVLFRANRKDESLATWHAALAVLLQMQQRFSYPESFFANLETITRHLGERHLLALFRPELEAILGPYLAHNGTYRSNELLRAVYSASATPEEGIALLLTLANNAAVPGGILADLSEANWLAPGELETLLMRRMELDQSSANSPDPNGYAINSPRHRLLTLFLNQGENAKAQAILHAIVPPQTSDPTCARARILLAARTDRLGALLTSFEGAPETTPSDDTLLEAADALARQPRPDARNARTLREYVFNRKQLSHTLIPTDFLSLAQSRLDTNDLAGALTLLRRLTLYVSNSEAPSPGPAGSSRETTSNLYANTDAAAALLEAAHHPAEAIPLLKLLVAAVPWSAEYRVRLGRAQLAAGPKNEGIAHLTSVAGDASAPYDLRVQAARALGPEARSGLGSRELDLVARPDAQGARQTYFVEARLAAAQADAASCVLLLREAIAIAPEGVASGRARLDLLLAQPSSADPSATLAVLSADQAMVDPAAPEMGSGTGAADDGMAAPDGAAELSPTSITLPTVELPPAAASLDRLTRLHLATLLAEANERVGNLTSALAYMHVAVTLSGGDPELLRKRDELKRQLLLNRLNALRVPHLRSDLAPSTLVRPRLTPQNLAQNSYRSSDWEQIQ